MRFDYILTEKLLHIRKRGLLMAQRSSASPLYTFFALRFGNCCVVPENIHTTPREGIGNSWRVGGSQRPKILS